MFQNNAIDFDLLKTRKKRAVPEGVIPLTAADPDFKSALKLPTQSLSLQRPLFLLRLPKDFLSLKSIATYTAKQKCSCA
jgi:aminotransferase/cystathionine beta-lyase